MTYFDQKKFKLSLDDLDQAIKLNPTSGIAYFYRGACKDNLKDAGGGCADLKKSAELGYKEAEERVKKYCR
jgi:tetratricopeptide (TPR) repeat protein